MNKRITNIIMGLLLVLLMGILVGCPTEAPKDDDKKGDDGGGGPIVINGKSTDWRTENITGGVRIVEYKGTDINIVIPTLVDGTKVLEAAGLVLSGTRVGMFGQKSSDKNTTIKSVDMSHATYLTIIGSNTFSYLTNLKNVILPEGLTTIGQDAFASDRNLLSIAIPASVSTIVGGAFNDCRKLAKVTLSEGLETIGRNAFGYTALTSIVLPRSLKSIGSGVFYNTSLTTVVILRNAIGEANPLTTIGTNVFAGETLTPTPIADDTQKATTKIYYPKEADYQNAPNWTAYKTTTTWVEGTP